MIVIFNLIMICIALYFNYINVATFLGGFLVGFVFSIFRLFIAIYDDKDLHDNLIKAFKKYKGTTDEG